MYHNQRKERRKLLKYKRWLKRQMDIRITTLRFG